MEKHLESSNAIKLHTCPSSPTELTSCPQPPLVVTALNVLGIRGLGCGLGPYTKQISLLFITKI